MGAVSGGDSKAKKVQFETPAVVKRVLIVEDHELYAGAVAMTLRQLSPNTVVTSALSLGKALVHIAHGVFDLILLDLHLSDAEGLDGLVQIRDAAQRTPIMVISGDANVETAKKCLESGAIGFIPKTSENASLNEGLKCAMEGRLYLPEGWHELIAKLQAEDMDHARIEKILTDRQKDVLKLMSTGLPNKGIAEALDIAVSTVKLHLGQVFKVLGVSNRTEAVAVAAKMRISFIR